MGLQVKATQTYCKLVNSQRSARVKLCVHSTCISDIRSGAFKSLIALIILSRQRSLYADFHEAYANNWHKFFAVDK